MIRLHGTVSEGRRGPVARRRMLRIALVAVSVVLAASAAGASAAPEWAACVKATPKNTGNFSDKLCSVASEPGKGKYALAGGSVGNGKAFHVRGVTAQTLHVVAPGGSTRDIPITCTKLKGSGSPVSPDAVAGVVLEFSKCTTLEGAVPCENIKHETIRTEPLSGVLAEAEGKVGSILRPESGEFFATFTCGAVFPKLRVLGQVFGEITGMTDTISKLSTAHYVVGPYLGSVEYEPGRFYEPLTNPPTAGPPGYGVLAVECLCNDGSGEGGKIEYGPPGGLPSGLEGEAVIRSQALMIKT